MWHHRVAKSDLVQDVILLTVWSLVGWITHVIQEAHSRFQITLFALNNVITDWLPSQMWLYLSDLWSAGINHESNPRKQQRQQQGQQKGSTATRENHCHHQNNKMWIWFLHNHSIWEKIFLPPKITVRLQNEMGEYSAQPYSYLQVLLNEMFAF